MPPITYTARYKPNRWSHVPEMLLGYATGFVICMLIRFFEGDKLPNPAPFLGILLIIVIARIVFPENRNQLYQLMVNESTREIGILYFNPYNGFEKRSTPFGQVQIRFIRSFWKKQVRGICISIKGSESFILQKGRHQFSESALNEAVAQLGAITHVVGRSNRESL